MLPEFRLAARSSGQSSRKWWVSYSYPRPNRSARAKDPARHRGRPTTPRLPGLRGSARLNVKWSAFLPLTRAARQLSGERKPEPSETRESVLGTIEISRLLNFALRSALDFSCVNPDPDTTTQMAT